MPDRVRQFEEFLSRTSFKVFTNRKSVVKEKIVIQLISYYSYVEVVCFFFPGLKKLLQNLV